MTKLKADCSLEEWAAIRERAKGYDAKQRKTPARAAYMKNYMDAYTKTPEYREQDNARYSAERRQAQLDSHRVRAYGVSKEAVDRTMLLQGGVCALCRRPFRFAVQATQCVDHCHQTGTFRGLLCRMCNTIEGFIRNLGLGPVEFAERMQAYLDNPPANQESLW